MELKLNLFVHGVPKGQKIWGPQEEDRIFLESFYSRKPSVEVQLQVDVFQIGGNLNCYYTYLRGGNILDKDNRQGSYFALTVRVNAFYNDLFNMFNILDATYNKYILRTILTSDESSTRFIVDDFQQSEKKLQDIEKEIINYLSSFSISSDFISLDNFAANAKSESPNINLLECNNKSVLNYIKEKGNISVSPFYPSRQFVEFTRKKDEEIKNIKLQSQQLIAEEKKKSEQEILIIKKEYASADKTISDLRKQLETEKNNSDSLKGELSRKNETINEFKILKQKFDNKEQEFNKSNKILSDIKSLLNGLNIRNVGYEGSQPNRIPQETKYKKTKFEQLNTYLPLTNIVLTIVVIFLVLFSIFNIYSNQNKENDQNEQSDQYSQEYSQDSEIQSNFQNSEMNNSENEFSQNKDQYRIDIEELKNNDTIMSTKKWYKIHIKPESGKGKWKTTEFTFTKDSSMVKPMHIGKCKIDYVINEQVLVSRIISVK